jgi:hypothetical protein
VEEEAGVHTTAGPNSDGGTHGWRGYLWHCTQTSDDLMFVPEGLRHGARRLSAFFSLSLTLFLTLSLSCALCLSPAGTLSSW